MIVEIIRGRAGDDPALEVALAQALLQSVAGGERGPVLRVYRPRPTVAFGRQDSLREGFEAAAASARAHGFEPVVRAPGGHAAAYDEGCLVLDEIMPALDSLSGTEGRFESDAQRQAQALRELGLEARVGEVPGEYCPGRFTVGARGEVKLIGSAQRIVRGAWLLSTVVVVEGEGRLRPVLTDVYSALGLDWDPRTVGSVTEERSGVRIEDVEQALLSSYAARYRLVPTVLKPSEIAAAELVIDRHRIAADSA